MKLSVCFFILSLFLAYRGLYAINSLGLTDAEPAQVSVRRRPSQNGGAQLSQDQALFFAFYQRCVSGENPDTRQEDLKRLFGQRSLANADSDEEQFSRLIICVRVLVNLSSIFIMSEIASGTSVRSWLANPEFKTLRSAPASLENLRDNGLRNRIFRTLQSAWAIWTEV